MRQLPRPNRFHLAAVATLPVCALTWAAPAGASELIARDVSAPTLAVSAKGVALVTYRQGGAVRRVAAWGAVNATLRFQLDYTGGVSKHVVADPARFPNACRPYTGPQLTYVTASCTAPDGSWWVLQQWQRVKPDHGGLSGPVELRLSHFTGAPATLWASADWEHGGRYEHLWGVLSYQGHPWFGTRSTSTGYVLDAVGRNVSFDAWSADYPGATGQWRRVNAILASAPNGQFCLGLMPKGGSAYSGRSATEQYFASVAGPGVSPDVFTFVTGHRTFDAQVESLANQWQTYLANGRTEGGCADVN